MNAIILAGGQGSRMEHDLPKHLIEVKGKAILAYQLDYFLNSGVIDKVILALGNRANEYIDYINLYFKDKPIEFSVEHEPLGTGGAIKLALKKSTSDFVVISNGDDITDMDLKKLAEFKDNAICVSNPALPFGVINEVDGYIEFNEKPVLNDIWVSVGWYLFNVQQMLDKIPDKSSIEYDVFPKVKMRMFKHQGFWQALNTKKDLNTFEYLELPDSLK